MVYGTKVERILNPLEARDVIGEVDSSPAGNIILRVGRTRPGTATPAWTQYGHVVLTPLEAHDLVDEILTQLLKVNG